jgi:hypothetical protein
MQVEPVATCADVDDNIDGHYRAATLGCASTDPPSPERPHRSGCAGVSIEAAASQPLGVQAMVDPPAIAIGNKGCVIPDGASPSTNIVPKEATAAPKLARLDE